VAEDDLGKPPAQVAVVIHLCEAQVFIGKEPQPVERFFYAYPALVQCPQKRTNFLFLHGIPNGGGIITCAPRPFVSPSLTSVWPSPRLRSDREPASIGLKTIT